MTSLSKRAAARIGGTMNVRIARITLVALLAALALPLRGSADDRAPAPSTAQLQEAATALYDALTPEQQKTATLPFDSPERERQIFTGGERAGIQIRNLTPSQQKQALALLTAFTSDYGRQKALAITEQKPDNPADNPGFGRYYLCYFGQPGPTKTYAWRIAEHHLTQVHVEVEKGEPKSFGPILLGANPPVLWDDEEDKMIALYGAMTPEERQKSAQHGKGISSKAWAPAEGERWGVRVGDLNPTARQAAQAVLDSRLKFFSDPIRKQAERIIASQGGLDAMHVGFWGPATKRCRAGGRWDFKLAGPSFLCDYENSRGHIHMSMKGTLGEK
jgi:hypothetical protein